MLRDGLITSFIAASCLTQLAFASPAPGIITPAPSGPIPTTDAQQLLPRAWSDFNPTALLPWLFSQSTPTSYTVTPTTVSQSTCNSAYTVPGGQTATYCGSVVPSITGVLGSSLAGVSTAAGNTGGLTVASGSTTSRPSTTVTSFTVPTSGGTVVTSFQQTGSLSTAAATQTRNAASTARPISLETQILLTLAPLIIWSTVM